MSFYAPRCKAAMPRHSNQRSACINDNTLGGGMAGQQAGDMTGEIALDIKMGADPVDIGKTIHPHHARREHRHGGGDCAWQLYGCAAGQKVKLLASASIAKSLGSWFFIAGWVLIACYASQSFWLGQHVLYADPQFKLLYCQLTCLVGQILHLQHLQLTAYRPCLSKGRTICLSWLFTSISSTSFLAQRRPTLCLLHLPYAKAVSRSSCRPRHLSPAVGAI
jgi:hypothetical protein